jgi:hypothetical protein
MSDQDEYLERNRALAARLAGRRLQLVDRLQDIDTDEDPRLAWGPALIESQDHLRWVVDVEESRSNVFLYEPTKLDELLARRPVRHAIATGVLAPLVGDLIARVETIARPPDPWRRGFEMCGLRLTLAPSGLRVAVGTHLTTLEAPGTWFLLPDELAPELIFRELAQVEPAADRPVSSAGNELVDGQLAADWLEYTAGNEHDPGDPFGRTVLRVATDGTARLDVFQRTGHRAFRGRIASEAAERLRRALASSPFPAFPRQPVPAGSAVRTLVVQSGSTRQSTRIGWHAARQLPGYDELFGVLDSLVTQMSRGRVRAAPDILPPSVTVETEEPLPGDP